MPPVKQIVRIGEFQGVILDKSLLEMANLDVGQEVELTVEGQRIVITPRPIYASDEEVREAAERTFKKHERSLRRLAR